MNLTKLARQVVGELRLADPDRGAEFLIEDGLVVQGDPQMLEVVVRNLLEAPWSRKSSQTDQEVSSSE